MVCGNMAPSTENIDISIKEMIPIVIAAEIWGESWETRRILFRTDKQAVFAALKSGLYRDHYLAFCLRGWRYSLFLIISLFRQCSFLGK